MSEYHDLTGFIVDGFPQTIGRRSAVALLGRASDGRTFAVVDDRHKPRLYVRAADRTSAERLLGRGGQGYRGGQGLHDGHGRRGDDRAGSGSHVAAAPRGNAAPTGQVGPEGRSGPEGNYPLTGQVGPRERAGPADSSPAGLLQPTNRITTDGEAVLVWNAPSTIRLREADQLLRSAGVRTYEADLSPVESLCLDAGILGTLRVRGEGRPGRNVDLVFHNPDLQPGDWQPELTVLSLDIETDVGSGAIIAISFVSRGPWANPRSQVVLVGQAPETPWITTVPDEPALLTETIQRIQSIDPDIITGWNVIDFDIATIAERLAVHRIPFAISRSDEPARFLPVDRDRDGRRRNAGVSCRGRLVIDGLRLLRYGPQNFEDRRLDSVAQAVLGEGKTIQAEHSRDKVASIMRLYREDPVALCEYCRRDAELVLQILEKTGLLKLTIARSRLTGVSLNRAWTSVPAFEFLYIESMHRRGLVAPTFGVDRLPQGEAPGGAIITPTPGLYDNVLVFDFKSLYPSIMRTFNIDPVAYRQEVTDGDSSTNSASGPIQAPNGAVFSREPGILPELLDRLWESRDRARQQGDEVARYVYKIIMNSFYGVLGAPQCRFAGSALAGAITSFGQHLLHWTQARFEAWGYPVLYGDTDSLFVPAAGNATVQPTAQPPAPPATDPTGQPADQDVDGASDPEHLWSLGRELALRMNRELTEYIENTWHVPSRLELEFEKAYGRFYLPRMRGVTESGESRGRAKSYAGLLLSTGPQAQGALEIKGMEAVRSDWTRAAADFQTELLQLILAGAPLPDIEDHIRDTLRRLKAGELDDLLLYTRRLRKPVSAYTRNRPPHVQAALLLPPEQREGRIQYLMTTEGPQPPSIRSAPVDLNHYAQKQLRPIAETLCEPLGIKAGPLFDFSQQLSLF